MNTQQSTLPDTLSPSEVYHRRFFRWVNMGLFLKISKCGSLVIYCGRVRMGWKRDTRLKRVTVLVEAERAEYKRGKNESEGVEGNDGSRGTSPGVAEQSQLGPNAPGKHQEPTTPKRRAAHGARLWDGFTIFLTGHDISLGLAAKRSVWQPPAYTLLGNTPGPTRACFKQNWRRWK